MFLQVYRLQDSTALSTICHLHIISFAYPHPFLSGFNCSFAKCFTIHTPFINLTNQPQTLHEAPTMRLPQCWASTCRACAKAMESFFPILDCTCMLLFSPFCFPFCITLLPDECIKFTIQSQLLTGCA